MGGREGKQATTPVIVSGPSAPPKERVACLECRGKTALKVLETLGNLLGHPPPSSPSLLLFVSHLEQLEDSIVGFLLGLSTLLRASRWPVVLVDPSGFAQHVLGRLAPYPNLRLFRHDALFSRSRGILVVDELGAPTQGVQTVLGALGHPCDIVHSAGEARRAISAAPLDCVLLDLELSHAQSLGLAGYLKEHHPATPLIGMTSVDDVWGLESLFRAGFRSIVSKPYSVIDVLTSISEVLGDRPGDPAGEKRAKRPEGGSVTNSEA